VFPSGNRIRVDLSGSDCCALGADPNPTAARVTVHQDAHHPSHVEIPVIGKIAAKKLGGRHGGHDDDDNGGGKKKHHHDDDDDD